MVPVEVLVTRPFFLAHALAPAGRRAAVQDQLVLEELLTAEELTIGVVHPACASSERSKVYLRMASPAISRVGNAAGRGRSGRLGRPSSPRSPNPPYAPEPPARGPCRGSHPGASSEDHLTRCRVALSASFDPSAITSAPRESQTEFARSPYPITFSGNSH